MDISITIPIEEYIDLRQARGQRWATIDDKTRLTITNQEGWEQSVYIEEIKDSPVFKLWRLKDWQWNREVNPEIKQERKQEEIKEQRERHQKIESWKIEARKKLREKTKLDPATIEKYIRGCLCPSDVVKRNEMEGEEEYLNRLSFYTKLQQKLGCPIELL